MVDESEEWISATDALETVATALNHYEAVRAICSRANDGLIAARAAKLVVGDRPGTDNTDIPESFWWARGKAALEQNWATGDFDTWIDRRVHWRAYGVSFSRSGIETLIGPTRASRAAPSDQPTKLGGRPPAAWWDDLWIEMCRQLYGGDLQPKRQSDIESAMKDWASAHGHHPSSSTIRERARKLWTALSKEDEN
jgi:hypothetical protein